jgi:predicted nucleotidyltransferase
MLFGNKIFRKKLLNKAGQFANDNNIRLIYGCTMGSISRGTQNRNSDYDIRFLYIKNDFPIKLYDASCISENEIHLRKYTDEIYNCISFWEATSFIRFLFNQEIDGKKAINPEKLYFMVFYMFYSPYTWDRFGIQEKIRPILDVVYNKKMSLSYYLVIIHELSMKLDNEKNISINKKRYLDMIWAALSISWLLDFCGPAPIHLSSLFAIVESSVLKSDINNVINSNHDIIMTISSINNFINEKIQGAENNLTIDQHQKNNDDIIYELYDILIKNIL